MTAPDELLDGATIPWDFISGDDKTIKRPVPTSREYAVDQSERRRLIAAGRWRRG